MLLAPVHRKKLSLDVGYVDVQVINCRCQFQLWGGLEMHSASSTLMQRQMAVLHFRVQLYWIFSQNIRATTTGSLAYTVTGILQVMQRWSSMKFVDSLAATTLCWQLRCNTSAVTFGAALPCDVTMLQDCSDLSFVCDDVEFMSFYRCSATMWRRLHWPAYT